MTKEQAKFFLNALEVDDIEAEIMPEYSGRGMYGKTTFAVSVNASISIIPSLLRHLENLKQASPDFSKFILRQDSLGLGIVLY
jgi:hypothetical protein